MPRSRYLIHDNAPPYFLTCTVINWLPVFTQSEAAETVVHSWRFLQEEGRLVLYGYVILVNHVHLVASSPDLAKAIGEFKSFTAKEILRMLGERGARTLLWQLTGGRSPRDPRRRRHLWRPGSHPQEILSEDMMRQKLDYIHENPVRRGYVDDPLHWRFSSARNYARLPGVIPVETDW